MRQAATPLAGVRSRYGGSGETEMTVGLSSGTRERRRGDVPGEAAKKNPMRLGE